MLYIPMGGVVHEIEPGFDLGEIASIKHAVLGYIVISKLLFIQAAKETGMTVPDMIMGLPAQEFIEKMTHTAQTLFDDRLEAELARQKAKPRSMLETHVALFELGFFDLEEYITPVPPPSQPE